MNCCKEHGDCRQGRDCPARKDKFPQSVNLYDDVPPVTFDDVVGWIRNALAGVGVLACIVAIGFWSAR